MSPRNSTSSEKHGSDAKHVAHVEPVSVENVIDTDERILELAANALPFYKRPNLLSLYLRIIPGCLIPAVTLGFDAAMMNGLQAVPSWDNCKQQQPRHVVNK